MHHCSGKFWALYVALVLITAGFVLTICSWLAPPLNDFVRNVRLIGLGGLAAGGTLLILTCAISTLKTMFLNNITCSKDHKTSYDSKLGNSCGNELNEIISDYATSIDERSGDGDFQDGDNRDRNLDCFQSVARVHNKRGDYFSKTAVNTGYFSTHRGEHYNYAEPSTYSTSAPHNSVDTHLLKSSTGAGDRKMWGESPYVSCKVYTRDNTGSNHIMSTSHNHMVGKQQYVVDSRVSYSPLCQHVV